MRRRKRLEEIKRRIENDPEYMPGDELIVYNCCGKTDRLEIISYICLIGWAIVSVASLVIQILRLSQ